MMQHRVKWLEPARSRPWRASLSLVGGCHCQYAAAPSGHWDVGTAGCHATETLCGARPNITRAQQAARTLALVVPFLDAALVQNEGTWAAYKAAVAASVASGASLVLSGQCDLHDS